MKLIICCNKQYSMCYDITLNIVLPSSPFPFFPCLRPASPPPPLPPAPDRSITE